MYETVVVATDGSDSVERDDDGLVHRVRLPGDRP